jgi:hypothetical protein
MRFTTVDKGIARRRFFFFALRFPIQKNANFEKFALHKFCLLLVSKIL